MMKKITALFLAVLMLFSLAACGSSAAKGASYSPAVSAPAAGNYYSGAVYDSDFPVPEPEAPMAAEEGAWGGFSSMDSSSSNTAALAGSEAEKTPDAGDIAVDKIIYSASATVETTDFDGTLEKLEAMILQYGGSVKPANATEIMNMDEIDGALVGGASLKAADLMAIIDF